jgi:GNAT superfamily N-acetyltransferase
MAVDPDFQGKGVGFALAKAIEERAKLLGGKTLYIESNTVLGPAMHLYQKRGFVEIEGEGSPYERCNIYFVKEI